MCVCVCVCVCVCICVCVRERERFVIVYIYDFILILMDDYTYDRSVLLFYTLLSLLFYTVCDMDRVNQKTNFHVLPKYEQYSYFVLYLYCIQYLLKHIGRSQWWSHKPHYGSAT